MKKLLFALAALLLTPGMAAADDLSATLTGDGQGLAVVVTQDAGVYFEILADNDPTGAQILQGNSVFLDLNASFTGGFAAGTVNASASQLNALNTNTANFSVRVQGGTGTLTGPLASAGPPPGDGGDDGGDGGDDGGDGGGDDGGDGDDGQGELIDSGDTSVCVEDMNTLCLLASDRFEVTLDFDPANGPPGVGNAIELTADTGYFWFFNQENVEVVVKVIDACSFADRFWVFAGGLTDVNTVLDVRDTETGLIRRFTNPQQTPFQPIQATNAFDTCP